MRYRKIKQVRYFTREIETLKHANVHKGKHLSGTYSDQVERNSGVAYRHASNLVVVFMDIQKRTSSTNFDGYKYQL